MEAVLASLRNADPAEMRRGNWVPAYEDLTDDFHRFERDWNVALLLIHLGRIAEARRTMAGLESMSPLTAMGNLQADALRSLEAEILYRDGDRAGALDLLRTVTYAAPHGATYHAIADGTRSRYLQAELELELGDRSVAQRLFRGFDESWSPWDGYHRVLAHQRLGEIAEAEGRIDDALRYYGLLLDLRRGCDEDLVPLREEIRGRRDRLVASSSAP
jgi:tetratricopeptide (TPR) repeat protein